MFLVELPDKDKDKKSDYTYSDPEGKDGEEKKPTMEAQQAVDDLFKAEREEEKRIEAQQVADDRLKAETEEEKIIEANVDCLMHQIDAQNDARKLQMLRKFPSMPWH